MTSRHFPGYRFGKKVYRLAYRNERGHYLSEREVKLTTHSGRKGYWLVRDGERSFYSILRLWDMLRTERGGHVMDDGMSAR